eukprot:270647-Amphidinium_carterae.1
MATKILYARSQPMNHYPAHRILFDAPRLSATPDEGCYPRCCPSMTSKRCCFGMSDGHARVKQALSPLTKNTASLATKRASDLVHTDNCKLSFFVRRKRLAIRTIHPRLAPSGVLHTFA